MAKVDLKGNFIDLSDVGQIFGTDARNFYINVLKNHNNIAERFSKILNILGRLPEYGFYTKDDIKSKAIYGLFMAFQNATFRGFVMLCQIQAAEAWALLRIAIEAIAYADKINADKTGQLAELYVKRPNEEDYKKKLVYGLEGYFSDNLKDFLEMYKAACARGSHPTFESIDYKMEWVKTETGQLNMSMHMFDKKLIELDESRYVDYLKQFIEFFAQGAIYWVNMLDVSGFCQSAKNRDAIIRDLELLKRG